MSFSLPPQTPKSCAGLICRGGWLAGGISRTFSKGTAGGPRLWCLKKYPWTPQLTSSPKMIRPNRVSPNAARGPALASRVSWPGLLFAECSFASVIQDQASEPRVVQRHERLTVQISNEAPEPNAANPEPRRAVGPMEARPGAVGGEGRHGEPIDIHRAHHHEPGGHGGEHAGAALDKPHQQEHEWHGEMEHDQKDGDPGPAAARPAPVPLRLVRQVSGPDNEIL